MSEHKHIASMLSGPATPCPDQETLSAYANGELASAARHTVERHLLDCDLCDAAAEGLAGVETVEINAAVADLRARAWKRVGQLEGGRRRGPAVWVASAAAIVLLVVVGYYAIDRGQEKKMDAIASRMMEEDDMAAVEEVPEPVFAESEESAPAMMEPAPEMTDGTVLPQAKSNLNKPQATIREEKVESNNAYLGSDMADLDIPVLVEAPEEEEALPEEEIAWDATLQDEISVEDLDDGYAEVLPSEQSLGNGVNLEYDKADAEVELQAGYSFTEDAVMADSTVFSPANTATVVEADQINSIPPGDVRTLSANGVASKDGKERRQKKRARQDQTKVEEAVAAPDSETDANHVDYYRRGMTAYANQNFASASRDLRQAAVDTPDNLNAHFYAGRSFLEMQQYQAALFHFDRILDRPANSLTEETRWFKSVIMLRTGKKAEAILLLEQIRDGSGTRSNGAKEVLRDLK